MKQAKPDTVKLTTRKVLELLAGINALDGQEQAIDIGTEGKPNKKIIRVPYKLPSQFRLTMAKNMVVLTPVEQAYDAARKGVIREVANGEDTVPPNKMKEATTKIEELLTAEHDVVIYKASIEDLKLDDNSEMPISVIAILNPLWKVQE